MLKSLGIVIGGIFVGAEGIRERHTTRSGHKGRCLIFGKEQSIGFAVIYDMRHGAAGR